MADRWSEVLVADRDRLQWSADGILIDRHSASVRTQVEELELRRRVAAPFLESRREAVREATRHHSRGVMLHRAAEQVARMRAVFPERECIVVDLGCGFGWHWVDIAAAHPDVRFILVDFAFPNLQVCRNLMPVNAYPNVLCLQASILDLPFRSAAATLAWSVQVMQHIADPDRATAFREAHRILKTGGAFYIAWVRQVPMIGALSRVLARQYHRRGRAHQGLYLDRFDNGIRQKLLDVFPSGRVTLSESLFHPELRLRPRATWVGVLDLAISRSPIGTLMARQAEFSGEV